MGKIRILILRVLSWEEKQVIIPHSLQTDHKLKGQIDATLLLRLSDLVALFFYFTHKHDINNQIIQLKDKQNCIIIKISFIKGSYDWKNIIFQYYLWGKKV